MAAAPSDKTERARSASADELQSLLFDPSPEVLGALLENPQFSERLLLLLLQRSDLPREILQMIAGRRDWMRSYAVRLRVASHPHTPRLTALPLIRQLYLFDLVRISLLPGTPAEMRRLAEENILSRMAQLALGQKLTLARRGPARVAAALLAEGHRQVIPLVLDNANLTESQVLKVLARDDLPPEVAAAIAGHAEWSSRYDVRMALVRQPGTPLARILQFLPDLTLGDLEALASAASLSPSLREYLRAEAARRKQSGRRLAPQTAVPRAAVPAPEEEPGMIELSGDEPPET
jgi:hypothetical protein